MATAKEKRISIASSRMERVQSKKYKSSQGMLIDGIVNYYGGPRVVAHLLSEKLGKEFHEQSCVNWRGRGKIPLKLANQIAKVFKVPVYALNFKDAKAFTGSDVEWEPTVRACKFLPSEFIERVLSLKQPTV